jgi:hypothetical protein
MGCLGPGTFKLRHGGFRRIYFTDNRHVFPLPTFVISKNSAAGWNVCNDLPPLPFVSSPSVGFFRAVIQAMLPEKSRPEAGLRQSSSEGGGLRVVNFSCVRSSQLALAEAKSWS